MKLTLVAWLLITAAAAAAPASMDADLRAVAALPGEPTIVSAAGLTKADAPLLTIENGTAFDPSAAQRRLVIVGGFEGDARSPETVIALVRWFKTTAPASLRQQWSFSALPLAAPDQAGAPGTAPADRASLERWIAFQAPDVLVEIRDDGETIGLSSIHSDVIGAGSTGAAIAKILASAPAGRSAPHDAILRRVARSPLEVARLLAARYPETPGISYIPAVAWTSALRLSRYLSDDSIAARVRQQTAPWALEGQPLFGTRIQLTSVAGTMVFAELGGANLASLAREGARLAAARKDTGIAEYGQGWTDDMFMASAILSRVGDVDAAARLLVDYAARLQREDGIFIHATEGPFAWGRGNGFAALGLMELLTVLPERHQSRPALLGIYRRLMEGARTQQSPDGTWREVVDEAGAYREETATAMLMTAIARGVRLGWLDESFRPIVDRAWHAVSAHVADDGTLIDVCTGTGAGPTKRYYLDRAAITGADDRGGAMALLAAMEMLELRGR